jgi:serine/threonine-protein kinase
MLAGKPPFRGDTALSVALQHVRTQPERLENLRPDLPPALGRIVHKMLAKKPEERYQSPRELLRELRSLQIEGVDLHWPAELDELSSVETAALGSSSWQATQRLQSVMSDQTRARNDRRWLIYSSIAALLALALGGAAAWKLREPFMLEVSQAEVPYVRQMVTADAQLTLASSLNTEEGWQSVLDYFPEDKVSVAFAKEGLALLYLLHSDDPAEREKAQKICEHFANDYSSLDDQYRAFGLSGLVIIDFFNRKPQDSSKKLAELQGVLQGNIDSPQARRLLRPEIAQMLGDVVRRNAELLGKEKSAEWKQLLDRYSPTEEPGS